MILRRHMPKLNRRNILWSAAFSILFSVSSVENDCQRSKNECCSSHGICTNTCCRWGSRCEFFRGRIIVNHSSEDYNSCKQADLGTTSWSLLVQSSRLNSSIELNVRTFRFGNTSGLLYIHDGSSMYDPLIAVISWNGCDENQCLPLPKYHVKVNSGSAFLHSTKGKKQSTNQFEIQYRSVEPCDVQCSSHQTCRKDKKICECLTGLEGSSCNVTSECEIQCYNNICNEDNKCMCSLLCRNSTDNGFWSSLISHQQEGIDGRASHAVGVVGSWMWVVGGTALNEPKQFSHLLRYHLTRNHWKVVKVIKSDEQPGRVFGHSVIIYNDSLYVFGGDRSGHISSELWTFSTNTQRWTNLTKLKGNNVESERPVGVVGHTATLVHSKMIVLFGFSQNGYQTKVQEYSIVNGTWTVWNITGIDPFGVPGCYGHVSVYEPLTNRIIGHGGYRGIFLDDTWMYNPDKWTLQFLSPSPRPLLLHAAVIVGHVMYVYGGITTAGSKDQLTRNFNVDFFAFNLVCNRWKAIQTQGITKHFRRYGHSAVHHGRKIYFFGGFSGQMLNDVTTFSFGNCSLWREQSKCEESYDSTNCRWNSSTETCEINTDFQAIDFNNDERCSSGSKSKSNNMTPFSYKSLKPRINCNQRTTCEKCIKMTNSVSDFNVPGVCAWCETYGRCVNSDERLVVYPYNRCLQWTTDSCEAVTCSGKKTCRDCHTLPGCIWLDDYSGSKCLEGGFDGPKRNRFKFSNSSWSFSCPVCNCNKKTSGICDHSMGKCHCLAKGATGPNCSKCKYGYTEITRGGGCFYKLISEATVNLTGKTSANFFYAPSEFKRDVQLSLEVFTGKYVLMNLTSSYRAGSRKEREYIALEKIKRGQRKKYEFLQQIFKFGPPDYPIFKLYIFNVTGRVILWVRFDQPPFQQVDLLTYVLATFFGCFIAVLFVIALAWRIRSRYMHFVRSRQRRVRRRLMASRPFGKINILVDHPHTSPLKGSPNPIAVEYCAVRGKRYGSVCTSIMRLPTDENGVTPFGQSGICFASVLVYHNIESAKHSNRVSKNKISKKTPVTTWV